MAPYDQVYVWGRRHPYVSLSFLGIFNFTAPYLPWVLLAFSEILRSSPVVDILGMVAGVPCFGLAHALSQSATKLCDALLSQSIIHAGP